MAKFDTHAPYGGFPSYNEYRKAWRALKKAENPEAFKTQRQNWERRRDKSKRRASSRLCWERNKAAFNQRAKAWRAANPDKLKESRRKTSQRPESKIRRTFTTRLGDLLKRKTEKFCEYTGATASQIRTHLESQFKDGWTWENHGTAWEIDHVLPLSSFDLTQPDQIKIACNWQNLRPLAKAKNRAKSARITEPQMPLALALA